MKVIELRRYVLQIPMKLGAEVQASDDRHARCPSVNVDIINM